MAETLANLSGRLAELVAARNGTPTSAQYDQAVRDAVADFNDRAPRTKITTLTMVAGTASYALPADFLKPIVIESLTTPDGVIISPAGLIPVSATFAERCVWVLSI